MKNLLLLLWFLGSVPAFAQYDPTRVNKKALEEYNKGLEAAQSDQFSKAITHLQEAIRRDPSYLDAYLSLAGVFGQLKRHVESVSTYERAFALDSNYTSSFRLPYSINLAGAGRFSDAQRAIEALLLRTDLSEKGRASAEYRLRTYRFATEFARTHTDNYTFNPVNLGEGINTAESEYFPSIPIWGNELVFTRRLNNRNEDFFSSLQKSGGWDGARPLTGGINTPENEGAQVISQDGNLLFFTACYRPDGQGRCDLYVSYRTPEGWSEAMNLGSNINTEHWESQPSLSPDKRDLYFASNRPGGYGGTDIYVSHLGSNGRWSEPENLGPAINTSGEEACPFIHADNQTLYFTSNGHPGYGDEDLYLVRKGPNGAWSKPANLGYPINTIHREGTLFIAADGETAYYASDRSDSRGGLDIYRFSLRPGMRPYKTLWVRGQVFDAKTKAGLPSSVELIDLAAGRTLSKVQTDEKGGYLITLPAGKDYGFSVGRKGYLFYSDQFLLKDKNPDSTYTKDIGLVPIEVEAVAVLRNIFFDFGKYDLRPESEGELQQLLTLMKENPSVSIRIDGHTDNVGHAADNLKLSEARARTVMNYLIRAGISDKRLTAKGFGATRPVSTNDTEGGRQANRRTEVVVTGK